MKADFRILCPNYSPSLREKRKGIMLHDDGSMTDAGSLSWFQDERNDNASYNYIVLDDGQIGRLVPHDARAWHAGRCAVSAEFELRGGTYLDANSAFYGVATAAGKGQGLTVRQLEGVIAVCIEIFQEESWSFDEVWRITGHRHEAWPRGRKDDPYNYSIRAVRVAVQQHAIDPDAPSMAETLLQIKPVHAQTTL